MAFVGRLSGRSLFVRSAAAAAALCRYSNIGSSHDTCSNGVSCGGGGGGGGPGSSGIGKSIRRSIGSNSTRNSRRCRFLLIFFPFDKHARFLLHQFSFCRPLCQCFLITLAPLLWCHSFHKKSPPFFLLLFVWKEGSGGGDCSFLMSVVGCCFSFFGGEEGKKRESICGNGSNFFTVFGEARDEIVSETKHILCFTGWGWEEICT